jgi:hypothetical protein
VVSRIEAHRLALVRIEVQFQPIGGGYAHEDIAKQYLFDDSVAYLPLEPHVLHRRVPSIPSLDRVGGPTDILKLALCVILGR